jgi:hypothetical protein
MARAITWAIRLTATDGRTGFYRLGGVPGKGRIATFYSKDEANAAAASLREQPTSLKIDVIERSHGRRF